MASSPKYAKPVTVAEKFDNLQIAKFYRSLVFGLLRRANERELARMKAAGESNNEKQQVLERAARDASEALEGILSYLETHLHGLQDEDRKPL